MIKGLIIQYISKRDAPKNTSKQRGILACQNYARKVHQNEINFLPKLRDKTLQQDCTCEHSKVAFKRHLTNKVFKS